MAVAANRPFSPAAHEDSLVVGEVGAISLFRQRVGALDDARVDATHHERRNPVAEVDIEFRRSDVGLPHIWRTPGRAQRIGVSELLAKRRIRSSLLDDVHQAGDGAARELAAHHLDAHLDPRAGRAESLHCLALQEVHAHVRAGRSRTRNNAQCARRTFGPSARSVAPCGGSTAPRR